MGREITSWAEYYAHPLIALRWKEAREKKLPVATCNGHTSLLKKKKDNSSYEPEHIYI